jgi:hypothetical protein
MSDSTDELMRRITDARGESRASSFAIIRHWGCEPHRDPCSVLRIGAGHLAIHGQRMCKAATSAGR